MRLTHGFWQWRCEGHTRLAQENVTGGRDVPNDEPLIDNGVMTSLQTVELVVFLGDTFGIVVEDEEFDEENFKVRRVHRQTRGEQKRRETASRIHAPRSALQLRGARPAENGGRGRRYKEATPTKIWSARQFPSAPRSPKRA